MKGEVAAVVMCVAALAMILLACVTGADRAEVRRLASEAVLARHPDATLTSVVEGYGDSDDSTIYVLVEGVQRPNGAKLRYEVGVQRNYDQEAPRWRVLGVWNNEAKQVPQTHDQSP